MAYPIIPPDPVVDPVYITEELESVLVTASISESVGAVDPSFLP
jgi:hypothetical protein